ncbi:MAG TPA: hypothetical protein DCW60_01150 [Sutterella sp.]|nr:hypothetical protein [Sutterella sp.]
MPQKKNPTSLEVVKGKGGFLAGYFVGIFGAMKSAPYTNAVDVTYEAPRHVFEALGEAIAATDLLAETVKTIHLHKDRMIQKALTNFCTITELANTLVRREGISFRAAHDILADIVNFMLTEGKTAEDITSQEVNRFFSEHVGRDSTITDEEISEGLDPVKNALGKITQGGSAPEEVKRQIQVLDDNIACDAAILEARRAKVKQAKIALEKAIDDILG